LIAQGRTFELRNAATRLHESLLLTMTTGRQDYFVASCALALAASGKGSEAVHLVRCYLVQARRDRSAPSPELMAFAEGSSAAANGALPYS
jgi:hypothetical protein